MVSVSSKLIEKVIERDSNSIGDAFGSLILSNLIPEIIPLGTTKGILN